MPSTYTYIYIYSQVCSHYHESHCVPSLSELWKYITDGLRWACRYTGMCILIHLRTICPFNTILVYIIHYCKGLWLTVFYKEFGRGPSGYVWQPTKTTKRKKWHERGANKSLLLIHLPIKRLLTRVKHSPQVKILFFLCFEVNTFWTISHFADLQTKT